MPARPLWLHGGAGMGKSAILQNLAGMFQKENSKDKDTTEQASSLLSIPSPVSQPLPWILPPNTPPKTETQHPLPQSLLSSPSPQPGRGTGEGNDNDSNRASGVEVSKLRGRSPTGFSGQLNTLCQKKWQRSDVAKFEVSAIGTPSSPYYEAVCYINDDEYSRGIRTSKAGAKEAAAMAALELLCQEDINTYNIEWNPVAYTRSQIGSSHSSTAHQTS